MGIQTWKGRGRENLFKVGGKKKGKETSAHSIARGNSPPFEGVEGVRCGEFPKKDGSGQGWRGGGGGRSAVEEKPVPLRAIIGSQRKQGREERGGFFGKGKGGKNCIT